MTAPLVTRPLEQVVRTVDVEALEKALTCGSPGPLTTSGVRGLIHVEVDATREHLFSATRSREAFIGVLVDLHNAAPSLLAEVKALREVADAARASIVCNCNGGSGCPWAPLHRALSAISSLRAAEKLEAP